QLNGIARILRDDRFCKSFLAWEVIVKRSLRDICGVHYFLDSGGREAASQHQLHACRDQLLSHIIHCHCMNMTGHLQIVNPAAAPPDRSRSAEGGETDARGRAMAGHATAEKLRGKGRDGDTK